MRISFRRIDNDRYELAIVRADGRREHAVCETKSTLLHDFVHYAVETEARRDGGFWGTLARGTTLAEMNDREAAPKAAVASPELAEVERIVGALHGATHGLRADELAAGLARYADALGEPLPAWATPELVVRVVERLRQVRGKWNATPFGSAMDLDWPQRVP